MIKPGEYIKDVLAMKPGARINARGWVKTRRDSKGIHFLQVNDGSGFQDIQVVVEDGVVPEERLSRITTGACVNVVGDLVESPAAGQTVELRASDIILIGDADPASYPLQKKGHSMEFLREIAHLRARSNTFGAVFRVRNALSDAIHRFFQDRGFQYIHTPLLTASDCEGAGAMFRVTTLPLNGTSTKNDSKRSDADPAEDFFGKPAYLTVSGQLEAECLALALGNVYTFGPTFRAENSNTPRHLAEFWMVEPEMAFCDLVDDMELAEDFLKFIIRYVRERREDDLQFFNKRIDSTILANLDHVCETPFERITYTEAIEWLQKAGRSWEYPAYWGADLQSEHERYLTEELFKKPIIVTDYPKEIKAFYMRLNDDGKTVRAMDVLVPRIGEIIGGSQREERFDELSSAMKARGLDVESYSWYLDLRRYGSVPHAGFGLGLERMLMYLTGMKNIRDVIPFPRTPGWIEF
jgi:asparaginyl-tRNA synthetase